MQGAAPHATGLRPVRYFGSRPEAPALRECAVQRAGSASAHFSCANAPRGLPPFRAPSIFRRARTSESILANRLTPPWRTGIAARLIDVRAGAQMLRGDLPRRIGRVLNVACTAAGNIEYDAGGASRRRTEGVRASIAVMAGMVGVIVSMGFPARTSRPRHHDSRRRAKHHTRPQKFSRSGPALGPAPSCSEADIESGDGLAPFRPWSGRLPCPRASGSRWRKTGGKLHACPRNTPPTAE